MQFNVVITVQMKLIGRAHVVIVLNNCIKILEVEMRGKFIWCERMSQLKHGKISNCFINMFRKD